MKPIHAFFLFPPQVCFAQVFTVSAYVGKNFTSKTYLVVSQDINRTFLRFADINLKDRSFEFPLYYGIKISTDLKFANPKTFVELEFIHSKVYSDPEQIVRVVGFYRDAPMDSVIRFGDIVQNFSISHGLKYLFFNIGYRLIQKEGFVGFFKFGIGVSIPHLETIIDSLSFERYEINSFAVQVSCGLNFKIYKNLGGFAELKYTSGEIVNAGIYGGTAETHIKMLHIVLGVNYSFFKN